MALYDKASLVLIPSGTKEGTIFSQKPTNGDGDFTFSRSTSATRVGPSGYIEKETQNLIKNSQNFGDSQWFLGPNITKTTGQTDPNGGNTAVLMSNIGDSNGYFYSSVSLVANTINTFSIYIKGSSAGSVAIRIDSSSTGTRYDVNYTTEWTRVSGFQIVDQVNCLFIIGGFGTWTAGENIQFAFAQVEQGLVARDYIETTTSAVYGGITDNIPRLDYNGSCPSLKLEPQRTNTLSQSEYFGSDWTLGGVGTIDTNSIDSPEGIQNATKFKASTTSSTHAQIENYGGGNKSFSIFAKEGEESQIMIYGSTAGIGEGILFDLSDGSFVKYWGGSSDHIDSYSSTDYGNGWYRYEINFDTSTNIRLFIAKNDEITFPQTSGNGIYIYGAQFEDASYATSYIPTYGSAVTRNANLNLATIGSFSDIFGSSSLTQYSIFIDVKSARRASTSSTGFISKGDNTIGQIFYNGAQALAYYSLSTSYMTLNYITDGNPHKYLLVCNNGVIKQFFDGALIDTENNPNDAMDRFGIAGSTYIDCNLSSVIAFNSALSDEEAIALTTI